MSFNPNAGDWIGVFIPLTQSPTAGVDLRATVHFPDAVVGGAYVYPALYCEIEGPGIDPAPRLISQDASQGGTFTVETGATLIRVKLVYNAGLGPNATTAHGDIRRSLLQINGVTGNITSLKDRVWELNLTAQNTLVNMFQDSFMGIPHNGQSDVYPIVETRYYFRQGDPPYEGNVYFWAKYELERPLTSALSFLLTAYLIRVNTFVTIRANSSSVGADLDVYTEAFNLGSSAGSAIPAFYLYNQDHTLIQTYGQGPNSARTLPVGTKYFLTRVLVPSAVHNSIFANLQLQGGICHAFHRMTLETTRRGLNLDGARNWRVPTDTYVHAEFYGENLSEAPWANRTAGLEGGMP